MPKNVHGNLYVHVNYISTLPAESLRILRQALLLLPSNYIWTIAKVSADKGSVTFCHYPDFDENPHSELAEWMKIDLIHQMTKRGLGSTENPLILHRKETFVDERHHLYAKFHRLSIQEEKAGLYDLQLKNRIGRKRFWEKMLAEKGFRIVNHEIQAIDCYKSASRAT